MIFYENQKCYEHPNLCYENQQMYEKMCFKKIGNFTKIPKVTKICFAKSGNVMQIGNVTKTRNST